ncbi:MAG TPA: hypothetical protein VF881_17085 [Polyangiaceae bacterium]
MFYRPSPRLLVFILGSIYLGSCSSNSSSGTPTNDATSFTLTTPEITVMSGQERYVCFSKTLDEELAVDRFDIAGDPVVHHIFLSRSIAPEPEGLSECNVIFKQTWLPMFVTGNGSASLEYPSGAATVLHKGAQIVLQLHLLNASATDARKTVSVVMRRSTLATPDPVAIYAFGTQKIALPPKAPSNVVDECTPSEDVEAFATLAHMHKLGTALHFSIEGDDGMLHEVVNRDPYAFDHQFIEADPIVAPQGKKTQVTCSYNNITDHVVGFGESSNDEMCYLVGYIRGKEGAFGCSHPPSDSDGGSDAAPPNACKPTENAMGVGAPCTKGGNECKTGLSCSADQAQSSGTGPGFCLKIGGCTTNADCGGGDATCCAPAEGGGAIKICIPESCRPSTCAVAN